MTLTEKIEKLPLNLGLDQTPRLANLTPKVARLYHYRLPNQVVFPAPGRDDKDAPDSRNINEEPFKEYLHLQTGLRLEGPWQSALKAIQRREKFYYALFPGLLTGDVGASAALEAEHASFQRCLRLLRYPSLMNLEQPWQPNEIVPLTPQQRNPAGATEAAPDASTTEDTPRPAALPFRLEFETLLYGDDLYLSHKALSALGSPLDWDANTLHGTRTICKNNLLYKMLLRTITHVHMRAPTKLIFVNPFAKALRRVKPLLERPVVDGRRARGASWTEAEDAVLREHFSRNRRLGRAENLAEDKKFHEDEMRARIGRGEPPGPPFDAKAARTQIEKETWDTVLRELPERTMASVHSRLQYLNQVTQAKYVHNGFMPAARLKEYQLEYLGLRETMPRFREHLHGRYVPLTRAAHRKVFKRRRRTEHILSILPWSEDDDGAVIDIFVQFDTKAARHQATQDRFRGFRTDEEVLVRAHALKEQGYLPKTTLPIFTRKRGRPTRAMRATMAQPSAIPRPLRNRTDDAAAEGPCT